MSHEEDEDVAAAALRDALDPAQVDEVILTGGSVGDRPALEVLDDKRESLQPRSHDNTPL